MAEVCGFAQPVLLGSSAFTKSATVSARPVQFEARRSPVRQAPIIEARSGKSRFRNNANPGTGRRPGQVELPEDGTPVFTLFVRSKTAKLWYPVGALKGDGRSKQLVDAMQTSWGRRFYKGTLDKGVAKTISNDSGRLLEGVFRQFPQLQKNRNNLEFGYKVAAKDRELSSETTLITDEMSMGFLSWAKSKMGMKE